MIAAVKGRVLGCCGGCSPLYLSPSGRGCRALAALPPVARTSPNFSPRRKPRLHSLPSLPAQGPECAPDRFGGQRAAPQAPSRSRASRRCSEGSPEGASPLPDVARLYRVLSLAQASLRRGRVDESDIVIAARGAETAPDSKRADGAASAPRSLHLSTRAGFGRGRLRVGAETCGVENILICS